MVEFFKKHILHRSTESSDETARDRVISVVIALFSIVTMIGGLTLLFSNLWLTVHSRLENGHLAILLSLVLLLLSVILFTLSRIARAVPESNRLRETISTLLAQSLKPPAPGGDLIIQDMERLHLQMDQAVKLLQDINENTLLDEAGRRQKYEFQSRQERKRIFIDIDKLVQDREWAQVKALLENMQQKYPESPDVEGYIKQVEELRKQAFNEELSQTRRRVADFVAISAWDKAIRAAESLMEKHPDMPATKELLLHLRNERGRFREEQIKRMYADIQRSIGKKRWNDALSVTQQLMGKYPDSVEAETLRSQLSTLEGNAEIEKRQQLEEQIKDLIHRRNFIQARELAKYVLEHYPSSPQASALRKQITKLEELAGQQEKDLQL